MLAGNVGDVDKAAGARVVKPDEGAKVLHPPHRSPNQRAHPAERVNTVRAAARRLGSHRQRPCSVLTERDGCWLSSMHLWSSRSTKMVVEFVEQQEYKMVVQHLQSPLLSQDTGVMAACSWMATFQSHRAQVI